MSVLILSTTFIWKIFHSKKKSARYCHKCDNVFMHSTHYFCRILMKLWVLSTDFLKSRGYQISSESVQWELCPRFCFGGFKYHLYSKPLFPGCRLTGPGVEYAGKVQRSSSERECLPWTNRHKEVGAKEAALFPNSAFPETSRRNAKRRCRNPDGDPGGPWCYVEVPENVYPEEQESDNEKDEKGAKKHNSFEEEGKEEENEERVEKEYCDVPFCDEKGNLELRRNTVMFLSAMRKVI